MRLHERVQIVNQAKSDFSVDMGTAMNNSELHLNDIILACSQCLVNLHLKDEEKIIHSDFQTSVEEILSKLTEKHNLTYGEKLLLLTQQIDIDRKYVIRWERHGDLEKEGDFE